MISVLTIAASDPCGGAGIQADLRVFASQGVVGLSALTAITVQDTQKVYGVFPVSAEALRRQLDALLADCRPGAVKIGLLPDADSVIAVAEALRLYRPPNIVLDTVLSSTGGVPFLDDRGVEAMVRELLPLCALVTPNLQEAGRLAGLVGASHAERRAAAERLCALGVGAALIKGGHLQGKPEDLLFLKDGTEWIFSGDRVDTVHTHGTGCFLSSAIAARLALGDTLPEACRRAKAMLEAGLNRSLIAGKGRGSPDPFAGSVRQSDTRSHAGRLSLLRGLYVLTDPDLQGSRKAEDVAGAAFTGGAAIVQLRDKRLTTTALVETARRLQTLANQYDRLFIVNDRVDVAAASDSDGVHLGPDDMHPVDARQVLGTEKLIGVSVGTVEEAVAMAPFASYLAVGAIYGSMTKLDAGSAVGTKRIQQIRQAVPGTPIVAIGGITRDNIGATAAAGADSAAVISAVLKRQDIAAAVGELLERFRI